MDPRARRGHEEKVACLSRSTTPRPRRGRFFYVLKDKRKWSGFQVRQGAAEIADRVVQA